MTQCRTCGCQLSNPMIPIVRDLVMTFSSSHFLQQFTVVTSAFFLLKRPHKSYKLWTSQTVISRPQNREHPCIHTSLLLVGKG